MHPAETNANCQKQAGQMRNSSPGKDSRATLEFPIGSQIKVGEGWKRRELGTACFSDTANKWRRGKKKKGAKGAEDNNVETAMENKGQSTKLFEEMTDMIQISIILFIYLFAPGEKQSIKQAGKGSWYLHKRK